MVRLILVDGKVQDVTKERFHFIMEIKDIKRQIKDYKFL